MHQYRRTVVALAVTASFNTAWAAVESDAAMTLDPVVVAATRTPQSLNKVPASVSVVSEAEIAARQANKLSEALKYLPNVEFGGGPRSNGEIPSIRGYGVPSITVSIDGARQNWGNSNSLRSSVYIDPYFISRAEVLRGSASSLYGPGGLGGAMNFTTLSVSDFLEAGKSAGGGARLGYSGADRGTHANARAYVRNEHFDALLALGQHAWGTSIRQGGGTEFAPNDGQATNALLKLGATLGAIRLEASHLRYDSDNLENNNPQADNALPGAPAIQQVRTLHQQTQIKAVSQPQTGFGFSASVYENDTEVSAERGANPVTQPYAKWQTKTLGANLMGSYVQRTDGWGQRLAAGIDYYRDRQASANSYLLIAPSLATQTVTGLYLQDEITFGPFSMIPSLRHDRFETTVDSTGASTSNSHVSPKLALSWEAFAGMVVYGSYGEAFRAPTINEMYTNLVTTAAFSQFRANPNLRPEIDRTAELGAKFSRRNLLADGDDFRLRASFFDAKAKDLITSATLGTYTRSGGFTGTGVILQSQNVTRATRRGAELEMTYTLDQWRLASAYSRVRVTDDGNGNGLFAPPDKLSVQIRRQLPINGLSASWTTTGVAAQDYDATLLRRRPGYATHDLFLSWAPAGQSYRLDLGVSNLSDKRYAVYQSSLAAAYTYQEGRSIKAALSLEF